MERAAGLGITSNIVSWLSRLLWFLSMFYSHNLGSSVSHKVIEFPQHQVEGDSWKGRATLRLANLGGMYWRQPSPAKGVPPSPFLTKGILASGSNHLSGRPRGVSKQGFPGWWTPPDVVYIFNFNLLKLVITQEQCGHCKSNTRGGQSHSEIGSNPCSSRCHLRGKSSEWWAHRLSSARLLFEYPVEN